MSITGLLNQTITIATKSGYDKYGRENVDAPTTVKARFQRTTKQKLSPNGSLITIDGIVYVSPDTTVAIDDKITFDGADYKVHGIYAAVDGTGDTNHLKLEVIKWKATT